MTTMTTMTMTTMTIMMIMMMMTMKNLYVVTAPLLLIIGDQLEHPDDLANLNKMMLMMLMMIKSF